MTDLIIIAILLVVTALAARHVYKARKSGVKCIGCPAGGNCCSRKNSEVSACACGSNSETSTSCCHSDPQ